MGLLFVLMIWAVAGAALAVIASLIGGLPTWYFTRGRPESRSLVYRATLFPFLALAWLAVVFVGQALINETLLDRDPGLGDGFHCPLPNGYLIDMIDFTDHGALVPKRAGKATIQDVKLLQIDGRFLLGATDSQWAKDVNSDPHRVDGYFQLDIESGARRDFATLEELKRAASLNREILNIDLKPIHDVYLHYRLTWFDQLATMIALVPPVMALWSLLVQIRKVARTKPPTGLIAT